MEAKLVVVRGKASKGQIPLKLPTIIGRSREADLTVAHATISRKHCEIYEEAGTLRIRDLGSLNGTFVGKRQIKETELAPNAEFSVGPLTFRVLYERQGAAAAAPAAPLDESAEIEELPDFVLQEEEGEDGDYTLQEDKPTAAPKKTASPTVPVRSNGAAANADDDVLDFLMEDESSAKDKKKGNGQAGTDDDELDQFFKQLS